MNRKDALGRRGEQLAAEYLQAAGLHVVDRNWRCTAGEIDIVATLDRMLVVCEVKTRSGREYGTPLEAVSRRKLARLRHLAVRWVLAHGLIFDEIRIDVVSVLKNPSGEFDIEHVPGVG